MTGEFTMSEEDCKEMYGEDAPPNVVQVTLPDNAPIRASILTDALGLTLGDRNTSYGDPYNNLLIFTRLINAAYGTNLEAEDGAIIMELAKLSRILPNKHNYHEDNYTDGAAYMAIAGECHARRLHTEAHYRRLADEHIKKQQEDTLNNEPTTPNSEPKTP